MLLAGYVRRRWIRSLAHSQIDEKIIWTDRNEKKKTFFPSFFLSLFSRLFLSTSFSNLETCRKIETFNAERAKKILPNLTRRDFNKGTFFQTFLTRILTSSIFFRKRGKKKKRLFLFFLSFFLSFSLSLVRVVSE